MRLVFDKSDAVTKWVAARIPFVGERGFGPCKAIGVVGSDGREMGGVVFHDHQSQFKTIAFSLAADSPKWITRKITALLLYYPFTDCEVWKCWTATPHTNERALRLAAWCGFKKEATLGHHFGVGTHAIINRLYRTDYERLYAKELAEIRERIPLKE